MGINEFNAVMIATSEQGRSDPGSWAGSEHDPFWKEAHRRPG